MEKNSKSNGRELESQDSHNLIFFFCHLIKTTVFIFCKLIDINVFLNTIPKVGIVLLFGLQCGESKLSCGMLCVCRPDRINKSTHNILCGSKTAYVHRIVSRCKDFD